MRSYKFTFSWYELSHKDVHICYYNDFQLFLVEKKCEPNPCQNSGICRELIEEEDYKCECTRGFRGKDCEG